MKKLAVIDIGSNSVRLFKEDQTGQKKVVMTQLGKSQIKGMLSDESMVDTINAILSFKKECLNYQIVCFATEAIRSSVNGQDFIRQIKQVCQIDVEILSPKKEALCGYLGATAGKGENTVIDVGGASTEIITGIGEQILTSISVPMGASRITALCSEDYKKMTEVLDELFPKERQIIGKVYAVGGSATTLGAIKAGLIEYDSRVISGLKLCQQDIINIISELEVLSIQERVERYPILPIKRAEVIIGGAKILLYVMQKYSIAKLSLSDSDNMEGFLIQRSYEN